MLGRTELQVFPVDEPVGGLPRAEPHHEIGELLLDELLLEVGHHFQAVERPLERRSVRIDGHAVRNRTAGNGATHDAAPLAPATCCMPGTRLSTTESPTRAIVRGGGGGGGGAFCTAPNTVAGGAVEGRGG